MSKKKVLLALGVAAVAGATPVAVHAATRETKEQMPAKAAAKDTITCPITGEEIPACCCPLNKRQ